MRYCLLLIAFLALSAFTPEFPTPRGFVDLDAIRTAELVGGSLSITFASGTILAVPTSQKAGMIDALTKAARLNGLLIWTKPTKIINIGNAAWAYYTDPDVAVGWNNGDLETFTGAEADSIIAKRGVLKGLGSQ